MAQKYNKQTATPEEVLREARKSELDRRGAPKSLRGRHLDVSNYYHVLFNWFGRTYNRRVQIN